MVRNDDGRGGAAQVSAWDGRDADAPGDFCSFSCPIAIAKQTRAEESRGPERVPTFRVGLRALCRWLQQDWAEVLPEGKVWKTQLGRGRHGKEELEGKGKM